MKYNVDENGFYGQFGGAFIPEMLYPNVEELKENYLKIMAEPSFQEEFNDLLQQFVGRPTPLYFAKRLSEKYNTKIYLKREDLCHTGAHKINNTIGQILVAKRLGKTRIIAETGAGQHGAQLRGGRHLGGAPWLPRPQAGLFCGHLHVQPASIRPNMVFAGRAGHAPAP